MKFADLFCGIGGSSYGAVGAGLEPLALIDSDVSCEQSLSDNLRPFFARFDLSAPSEELWKTIDRANVLLCSPPCQSFSTLKSRNRKPNGHALDAAFAETIKVAGGSIKRDLILIENVPRFLQTEMAEIVITGLKKQGYYVSVQVLDAANFGVPQRRKRGIIVATPKPHKLEGVSVKKTVRDAFHGLPKINSSDPLHTNQRKHSPTVLRRIKAIPLNGGSRSSLPIELQLDCHQRSTGYKDVYGRMNWDQPAPTITSGCNNPSKGRFIHPEEHRAISLREAARLQTLPDAMDLSQIQSSQSKALKIGNAFPPKFVKRIIESAL